MWKISTFYLQPPLDQFSLLKRLGPDKLGYSEKELWKGKLGHNLSGWVRGGGGLYNEICKQKEMKQLNLLYKNAKYKLLNP